MAKASGASLFLRQHGPMALFGFLTLLGVSFIWTAKLWDLNTAFVTAVPIGIMFTYLIMSLVAGSMRVHNEQAGDNLYYMGFLFTLSSLGVSLYRFVGDVSIDEIVQNFGIAVTSTICGIAFRIMFNQMRRDPIEIERSVRHELAEMTRRVRTELDSSAREFSSYRRTSSQMLLEGFEEIAEQAEKTGEAVQKAIETLSRESLKPIQDAAAKLAVISEENLKLVEQRAAKATDLANAASERLNEATDRIATIVGGLSSTLEALTTNLNQMKTPDEVLRVEVKPILDAVSKVTELQKLQSDDMAKRTEAQISTFLEAVKPVTTIPGQIEASLQPVAELSKTLRENLAVLAEIPRQMTSLKTSFSETSASMREYVASHPTDYDSSQQSIRMRIGSPDNETPVLTAPDERTPQLEAIFDGIGGDASIVSRSADQPNAVETVAVDIPPGDDDDGKPKRGWFRKW